MTEKAPELLPCPFCADGGRPVLHHAKGVKCHKCGAWGPAFDFAQPEDWNTRAPQWRPISEAPRDGTELLCYVGPSYVGGSLILSWFKYNGTEAWRDWDCDAWEPTHFMFRPEAPNEP